jgi:phosphate uptake regulator
MNYPIESMVHRISEIPANIAKGKFKEHYQYDREIKKMVRDVYKMVRDIRKNFEK